MAPSMRSREDRLPGASEHIKDDKGRAKALPKGVLAGSLPLTYPRLGTLGRPKPNGFGTATDLGLRQAELEPMTSGSEVQQ